MIVSFILIIFVISLQGPYLIAIQRTLSSLRGIVISSHSGQSVNYTNYQTCCPASSARRLVGDSRASSDPSEARNFESFAHGPSYLGTSTTYARMLLILASFKPNKCCTAIPKSNHLH